MPPNDRTLHKFSPKFTIAAGTQVVLQVSKAVATGEYKKAGNVGVVLASPPTNDHPYEVQFTDGQIIKAFFHELTIRRKEVECELAEVSEDLRPFIIYRCQVGSKAYGLANADSDDDLRGIFLPPARLDWSLYTLPEQIENVTDTHDEVYWELEKYLLLALKSNPTVLETLWTPLVLSATPLAEELRTMRQAFLSQHLYKTYSGYVLSQFRRMAAAYKNTSLYKAKHAMHLVRLLHSGIHALRTGEILIDISDRREELLRICSGAYKFEEVKAMALELERDFQQEFARTELPEQPDFPRVNDFLVRARRNMVDV